METLKEAVITKDKRIKCPICGKVNGQLFGGEKIENYRVRCRGSNSKFEHFFALNVGMEESYD